MARQIDLTEQKLFRNRLVSDEELQANLDELLSRCDAGEVGHTEGAQRFMEAVAAVITARAAKFRGVSETMRWDAIAKFVELASGFSLDCPPLPR
jgi:hypothetical protein